MDITTLIADVLTTLIGVIIGGLLTYSTTNRIESIKRKQDALVKREEVYFEIMDVHNRLTLKYSGGSEATQEDLIKLWHSLVKVWIYGSPKVKNSLRGQFCKLYKITFKTPNDSISVKNMLHNIDRNTIRVARAELLFKREKEIKKKGWSWKFWK